MRKIVLKINLLRVVGKCIISTATHSATFKNGGVPTKSIISQLLPVPDHRTSY